VLITLSVSRNDAGQRADRYLRKQLPRLGIDRLNSLFRRKEIKVAKKPVARNHMLAEGDQVSVYGLKPEEVERAAAADGGPEAGPAPVFDIPVIHEDDDILVLDKPAGLAVHPGTGIAPGDSVIEKVRARLAGGRGAEGASGAAGWAIEREVFQPSLVHRLDKETSGVLLVAKSGPALRALTRSLREGGFEKRYLALAEGILDPPAGSLEGSLERVDSRAGGAKSEVSEAGGKTALTRYRTVKVVGNFSLLGVIIETGRMHQIRAHLAHAGHPLAGDSRYGSHERNRAYRKGFGLKRIFLHAADLSVRWPGRGTLAFHAPLPPDLASALARLDAPPEPAA
jgi:23S rRNA pseudouridine955/2504/2580 synthase